MGWTGVSGVRVGRHVVLTVEADGEEEGHRIAGEVAERLLSNPVIEDYTIEYRAEVGS
jgi:phosphoribosylformylglycinamidine synthase